MKAPQRLIEDDALLAELVDDARRRGPQPEALEALLRRLPAPEPPPGPAPLRSAIRTWIVVAGAGCVLAGVAAFGLRSSRPTIAPRPVAAAPSISPPVERGGATIPSTHVDDLPAAPAPAPTVAAATAPSVPRPAAAALRREIELIAAAREALTRGEASRCLISVRAYETEFPNGQFVLEAKVMRVEATAVSGDHERARALARDFLSKNPASPYEERIRSLLASSEGP